MVIAMDVVGLEQIINDSIVGTTATLPEEQLPDQILADVEKLEQDNAKKLEILADIFGNVQYDDSLDAMIADFAVEFPSFDILNYVDLELDSRLDDGISETLETIDRSIQEPVVCLNTTASIADEESYELMSACESEASLDVHTTTSAEPDKELHSLKSQMQQQQMLISELREQLNSCLKTVDEMKVQQKQQEVKQLSIIEISTKVQSQNIENDDVVMNNLAPVSDSATEEQIENELVENALVKCEQRNDYPISKKVERVIRTTATKPHKCKVCEKSFHDKYTLIRHLKIHIDQRPFVCDICNKAFGRKDTLFEHKKIHTGEKPHECKVCKQSFCRRTRFNSHFKSHANE